MKKERIIQLLCFVSSLLPPQATKHRKGASSFNSRTHQGTLEDARFESRNCLGCCSKSPLTVGVADPPEVKNQTVKDPVEDFWSTSTREMDNPSQRSLSSINTSNLTLDSQSGEAGPSNPPEFVNNGLLLWDQMREQWTGNRRSQNEKKAREPRISWNATYESLLGTNKPFPQPIPLSEMVDFLVEVWEQEGLYD